MWAQLYYKSEEGNNIPVTERIHISDSLEGLLMIPEEHEGNNAFWEYYNQSQRQADLSGGYHLTDNNHG